jgi:hypothetical protein
MDMRYKILEDEVKKTDERVRKLEINNARRNGVKQSQTGDG